MQPQSVKGKVHNGVHRLAAIALPQQRAVGLIGEKAGAEGAKNDVVERHAADGDPGVLLAEHPEAHALAPPRGGPVLPLHPPLKGKGQKLLGCLRLHLPQPGGVAAVKLQRRIGQRRRRGPQDHPSGLQNRHFQHGGASFLFDDSIGFPKKKRI